MCILLNVKKHEKTFALNVDIFNLFMEIKNYLENACSFGIIGVHVSYP